jgi:PTH1 family peptidyl-tRNA hydrolase
MRFLHRPKRETFLLIGLGNPGTEYRNNRHNAGFMLMDKLAAELGLSFSRRQMNALTTDGLYENRKVILAKPQTFVNLSGRPVASLSRFYKIPFSNLLVVFDDLDIPLGSIRLLPKGGTAGHRGMVSIIESLGTQEFPRLRIGIGRPPGKMDPADFVLQDFKPSEIPFFEASIQQGVSCTLIMLREGIQSAMTSCNSLTEAG